MEIFTDIKLPRVRKKKEEKEGHTHCVAGSQGKTVSNPYQQEPKTEVVPVEVSRSTSLYAGHVLEQTRGGAAQQGFCGQTEATVQPTLDNKGLQECRLV